MTSTSHSQDNEFDADLAVIGAGPAGAALAAFFARSGFSVDLFEKDAFPRFHIGESLLPRCVPVLLELGLDLEQEPYALRKAGAHFVCEESGDHFRFDFSYALPGTFPHAYQVVRADFDHAIQRRALAFGARLRTATVQRWDEEPHRVQLSGDFGQAQYRYAFDATGQNALGTHLHHSREWVRQIGKAGTFTHFGKVRSDAARQWFKQGDILVFLNTDRSWGWGIPLPGDLLSVGVVARDGTEIADPETAIAHFFQQQPLLNQLLEGAERTAPLRRIANFSYYNTSPYSSRTASLGDARAFLDPVFSSGVTLALVNAQNLAAQLIPQIRANQALDLAAYERDSARAYRSFHQIINRFYRPTWVLNTFFNPDKDDDTIRQITSILAGDVWRHDNLFQEMLLQSQR